MIRIHRSCILFISVWINSSRTHVRPGAWFWSAKADIFFSESLHILAERLSQSEIELPLRKICYYSQLAEVGVSTQTEINLTWTFHKYFIRYHKPQKKWSEKEYKKICIPLSLRWICQFTLTRITHQISRAFDLNSACTFSLQKLK